MSGCGSKCQSTCSIYLSIFSPLEDNVCMFLTNLHCHIIICHINFYEPIHYVPSAFHILVLPKLPRGSYYYSHVVDGYVCYVTDKGATDVILFSLTYINLNSGTFVSTCHIGIILPSPPLGQHKGLKGLASNRSFGGSPLISCPR